VEWKTLGGLPRSLPPLVIGGVAPHGRRALEQGGPSPIPALRLRPRRRAGQELPSAGYALDEYDAVDPVGVAGIPLQQARLERAVDHPAPHHRVVAQVEFGSRSKRRLTPPRGVPDRGRGPALLPIVGRHCVVCVGYRTDDRPRRAH
jgi:hypothetical protein